jgi:predicted metal-dependent peptidase
MTEHLYQRLRNAQRLLEKHHAYMAAAVLRLGTVHFTETVDTAAILTAGNEVKLLFNPLFLSHLDDEELAGVLAHEAMHFVFDHQSRTLALKNQRDRFLFQFCCEAVINDLIAACLPGLKLPGQPVRGQQLIGRDVSGLSAEEVLEGLRRVLAANRIAEESLATIRILDDHGCWEQSENSGLDKSPGGEGEQVSGVPERSSAATALEGTEMIRLVVEEAGRCDPLFGHSPLGRERQVRAIQQAKKDLSRFLTDTILSGLTYETRWTRPDAKLISVYPEIILPRYEPSHRWNVLIAIDSSGSIPPFFLAAAVAVANQNIPHAMVTLISFDTVAYELAAGSIAVKGGGGTCAQAVDDYAREKMKSYPDHVFVLTDGHTPPPAPLHPQRWVWILPPWGWRSAVPGVCRVAFFGPEELAPGKSAQATACVA